MDTIQQDIRNFTITEVTNPDCPQVFQEFIGSEYRRKRWIDTVLVQNASGHTVEAVAARDFSNLKAARENYVLPHRPQGFPSIRVAAEVAMKVNRARGFPGLQAAQRAALAANRAAGFPGRVQNREVLFWFKLWKLSFIFEPSLQRTHAVCRKLSSFRVT